MSSGDVFRGMGIGRPGRGTFAVMGVLAAVWLMFAVGINWLGMDTSVFLAFAGNTERILHGQVYRLVTAPLLHAPGTASHLLFTIIGLVFLTPRLEERWGTPRFLRFLALSSVFSYAVQMLVEALLPGALAAKLVGSYWFGSTPTLTAIAVAWALMFRNERVLLMFVIPVTSTGLILFIGVASLLRIVAAEVGPEGLLSPFGGMLAGWLFGGGTPSPAYLAFQRLRGKRPGRRPPTNGRGGGARGGRHAPFRVIEGGRGREDRDDDEDGPGGRMLH